LSTVKKLFRQRISTRVQAAKMDDIWPAEAPWAILKERLAKRKIKTVQGLRRAITEEWQRISPATCKKIINAVPKRLKMLIKKKGERLTMKRTQWK
jgi:hypothetical protein